MISSLAVFCGSKNGISEVYVRHAEQLGKFMGEHGIKMIYGGGRNGLMGTVADAAMKHNCKVTGIIPHVLLEWEAQHNEITELIVADDMHLRKKKCTNSATRQSFFPAALEHWTNYLKCSPGINFRSTTNKFSS